MNTVIQNEPSSFTDVIKHQVWKDAMTEEYESIMKNDVWDVVPRPQDKAVVTSKWIYKIKHAVDGSAGKALYWLKQAPRGVKLGFTRSEADPNLYSKVIDDKPHILVPYVDDLFITSADPLIHECKRQLDSKFEMKDLGLMHYFLGLEVWQKLGEIFLSQGKYVVKILERFGMVDCKPVTTLMELDFKKLSGSVARPVLRNAIEYHQLIGALMFLVNSRPEICFVVNTLSQHMVEPHH
eukprot:PITA_11368